MSSEEERTDHRCVSCGQFTRRTPRYDFVITATDVHMNAHICRNDGCRAMGVVFYRSADG